MSRGTETKSPVVIDKECAPSTEQETVQANGPGNAALAAQLPPAASAPTDGDSPTGPLAGSIHALVADSSVPPAVPRLTGIISVETFGARAVLFHNQGFWTASFWDVSAWNSETVKQAVDPLEAVRQLDPSTSGDHRAEAVRTLLIQATGERERLLSDARVRQGLLAGLTGLDRLRVLQTVVDPQASIHDPYILLQRAVLSANTTPAVLRDAWNEASVDTGIMMRLAGDLELRSRIEATDPDLAEQIRWEISRALHPEVGDSADTCDEPVPQDIYKSAGRPALKAMLPLQNEGYHYYNRGEYLTTLAVNAVATFVSDVEARLRHSGLIDDPQVAEAEPQAGLDWLAAAYSDYAGQTISETLAYIDGYFFRRPPTVVKLAEWFQTGAASKAPASQDSWQQTSQILARSQATTLHAAQGDDQALTSWAQRARQEARDALASAGANDPLEVEGRVGSSLRATATAYSDAFGPIEQLFQGCRDASTRRTVQEVLGLREDAAQQVAISSLETDAAVDDSDRNGGERRTAMLILTDTARIAGVELADAVRSRNQTRAEAIAEGVEAALLVGVADDALTTTDVAIGASVVEAAYAAHGGDLRNGVAQLENSDLVFRYLGMHSTGAALREDGDTRTDAVLAEEYRVLSATRELFDAVANSHPGTALGFADKALLAASSLVEIDGTERTREDAVADLYLQHYGIELSQHLASLPDSESATSVRALFGQRAAPIPELPDTSQVHRDFFLIGGQVPDGIDPNGINDLGNIQAMTMRHVRHLRTLAENLDGAVGDYLNGLPRFQAAIGDVTFTGGLPLVRAAFQRVTGATLEFYLHASHARGGISSTEVQSGLMGLDQVEQSRFTIDLLDYSREGNWSQALVLIETASAEDRKAMLADGQSMVLLRNEAPSTAWAPVYDALNGELQVSSLVANETSSQDWAEWFGSFYSALTPDGTEGIDSIFGVDEEEIDFDVDAIVAAQREDMSLDMAALSGARAAVDGDTDVRLDTSLGQGDARMAKEAELAHTLGETADKQAAEEDGMRLRDLGVGGSGTAEANSVDNDWVWQADHLRNALITMTASERAVAATDAVFLDRIDRLSEHDADIATQLFDLLFSGKDGAEATRITAYGTGTDGAWQGQGFEVVAALAKLSIDERTAIALDPARQEEWLRAARTDSGAEAEAKALLDTARVLMGAQHDAEMTPEDERESFENFRDDPVARAAYDAFVTRGIAQFRAAMATKDPIGQSITIGEGLRKAALEERMESTKHAKTGFPIDDAMTEIWLAVATEMQSHDATPRPSWSPSNRAAAVEQEGAPRMGNSAFSSGQTLQEKQIFEDLHEWDQEQSGDTEMDSFRGAASNMDVVEMVRLVKAMPIRKVAHRLTNLVEFGLHGEPPLNSVYQPFKRADAALEAVGPEHEDYEQLMATQQLALSALTNHPVNVSQNVNLYVNNASQSNHRLEDFSGAEQDQITGAIRGRFTDITPELVVGLLRADEKHASFLWNPTRAISASVRSTRDVAARSLTVGSWGVEHLTSTDDEASADYAQLAHGYQMALAETEMSDSDKERLERLQSEFKVSMSDFIAAKQKVAKVVSGVASTAIAAIITAVTAGTGAPVAAALLTTALSGGASIAIHEGILRDDYDAQEAGAELAVELLKTALTAHMDKFWTLGKAGIQHALLNSATGRQLLSSKAALQAVGTRTLGEFGMSLAGTAVDTATGDLSDVAWKMLDPSMYQHGFDTAMSDGLTEFEAALKGLGPNIMRAMLAECAKEAGKRAVADRPSSAGPNARSLGAQLPDAPDPDTEPRAFLEYLKKQLAGVPNAMWDEAVQTGVTGFVNTAVTEGEEYLLTGDDRIDVDRTVGVLRAAGAAALTTGGNKVMAGGVGAYSDYQGAHETHERAPQHRERMALIDELAPELSATERELLRSWSRGNDFEPIGDNLKDLEGGGTEADARVARAQALQDVETFRRQVLQPIEQQLDRHSTTWGEEQSEADRDSYRAWVMASSSGIDARLAVTPTQYVQRREAAKTQANQARESAGYRSLSAVEQEWFDHAAAHPTAIADLTKDTVALQIQVSTTEQADSFQRQLQAIQADVASQALTDLLPTLTEDQRRWAESNAAALTRGLAMSPSNARQNSDVVRMRTLGRYQDAQDTAVVSRVSGS